MKNYVPQQIELFYIIPALRKEFSKMMVARGLKQKQVACKLGITEAAVSQYLKDKRARKAVNFDEGMMKEIAKSVDKIMDGGNPLRELQHLCSLSKQRRITCSISERMGHAPRGCTECFRRHD